MCSTYGVFYYNVLCSRCVLLVFYLCSTYGVFYYNVLCSRCVPLVFHLCSTCDKQRISTDVIMSCCSVLRQHMSTCVVMCYISMCYDVLCQDVPHCNNSSHNVSTRTCASSTMEHNYLSITSL